MASDQPSSSSTADCQYLKLRPEKLGLINLFKVLFQRKNLVDFEFVECSDPIKKELEQVRATWTILFMLIVQKGLVLFGGVYDLLGRIIEFILNLFSNNGGLSGLIPRIVKGSVEIPKRGSANFRSITAHLDARIDLHKNSTFLIPQKLDADYERRATPLDFYMMASKVAYENKKYIQNAVTGHWKMHFEEFFDCYNGTQAFILLDKPVDASVIVVAFRGTELFNSHDWSMDFDLSWISLGGNMGRAHSGFMKALGMQDERDLQKGWPKVKPDNKKIIAYYDIRATLKSLLTQHKDAQIVVTGHSLGGALAMIFPTVLLYHEESAILERLRGIVTFGQPRVGDEAFANFMERELDSIIKGNCFRVVFRYDLVPRVPFDDTIFQFKHFGYCLYYRSWYDGEVMKEEPDKNYFDLKYSISKHVNAVLDLIRALTVERTEFKEDAISVIVRILGLLVPGVASHSPRDYVNAARLGNIRFEQKISFTEKKLVLH